MANGILAGHTNNTVWLSEPYQPHAWPTDYGRTVDSQIIGVGAYGQSLVVCTKSEPWILTGTDPLSMSFEKLAFPQACIDSRTIVSVGDGVMFASPDGLCYVGEAGPKIISEPLMSKEQWRTYIGGYLIGALYDSRYMLFYDNGTVEGCMVFSFTGVDPALSFLDETATAVFTDPLTDALYMVRDHTVYKFDSGTPLTYTWKSKLFTLPEPVCMATAQVLAREYPVSFKLYTDGALKYTHSALDAKPFRLPSGYLATDFEVQIEANVEVEQVLVATSATELKGA
jgi:hypothetical protein